MLNLLKQIAVEPDGSEHARHASEAVVHLRLFCVTSPSVHVHLSDTLLFCVSAVVMYMAREKRGIHHKWYVISFNQGNYYIS